MFEDKVLVRREIKSRTTCFFCVIRSVILQMPDFSSMPGRPGPSSPGCNHCNLLTIPKHRAPEHRPRRVPRWATTAALSPSRASRVSSRGLCQQAAAFSRHPPPTLLLRSQSHPAPPWGLLLAPSGCIHEGGQTPPPLLGQVRAMVRGEY